MTRSKTITILEAIAAQQFLSEIMESLPPSQKFQALKVQRILQDSLETAQGCMDSDQQKNQWMEKAETLPFQPLNKSEFFAAISELSPTAFLALKRLCA